jgi:Mg-chelatase subunit ChlI
VSATLYDFLPRLEAPTADHLLDRFAMALSAHQLLDAEQRVAITRSAIDHGESVEAFAARFQEETDALATQLILARQWLPDVCISREQIAYLVNEALRGHFRPEFLNRVDEIVQVGGMGRMLLVGP